MGPGDGFMVGLHSHRGWSVVKEGPHRGPLAAARHLLQVGRPHWGHLSEEPLNPSEPTGALLYCTGYQCHPRGMWWGDYGDPVCKADAGAEEGRPASRS